MLTQLTIQNFALVDRLELELAAGMTAITGETGAGKSIMLDALGLPSLEALLDEALPASIRQSTPLVLPAPRSEQEALALAA